MGLNIRDSSGSSAVMNLANLVLRVFQLIMGAAAVGVYAGLINDSQLAQSANLHAKIVSFFNSRSLQNADMRQELGIAVGSMSIITGIIFGILPFVLSYRAVAMACIWDWILVFIWAALFGTMHYWFGNQRDDKSAEDQNWHGVKKLNAAQWVDLTAMLLFLVSAIMGPVCLLMARKNMFASRAVA